MSEQCCINTFSLSCDLCVIVCLYVHVSLCVCVFLYHCVICAALDLPNLATGTFALLHLPKMPELKNKDVSSFEPYTVSLEDVPYKSKILKRQAKARAAKRGTFSFSFSNISTSIIVSLFIC